MSCFLRKTTQFGSFKLRTSIPDFLQKLDFFPQRIRWLSSSSNQHSFTVSYLINSLGFPPQTAFSVCKFVHFESAEKPDKVIKVFKGYGFTQTQISSLVRACPELLSFDAEKSVLPKLEFLKSTGLSNTEMAKKLSTYPTLLKTSLAKRIIPSYAFYRNLFRSDEKVIATFKKFPNIVVKDVEKHVMPSVNVLREYGVPDSNIATLFQNNPRSFMMVSSDRLRKIAEHVKKMGFDASKVNFVVAVKAFRSMNQSTWECKVDAYKKWGWSEEDVFNVFKRNPRCMFTSEDKIMATMDFFTNKMGWRPCLIAKWPLLLTMSLENRFIPRSTIIQVLVSKGLVKKEVNPHTVLGTSEKMFLQKFVEPYKEEALELLKLYKEKLNLANRNRPLVKKL